MLDVVTVLTYNAVINLAVMIVATIAWARSPRQKEIVFWAFAAWAMVIGTICSSLTEHVPYNILAYVGGLIYVARTGLIRLGFKEFYGQPYRLWHAFSIAVLVSTAMALAEVLEDPTPVRVSLVYLGSALNIGLGARDLWRGKPGERLPSGRLAAAVYAAYALASLVIAPLPILYPIEFVGRTPVSEWLTYTSMLLLVFNLLAFLMAMVLKLERGGEIQRQLAERDHLTGLVNRRMFLHQAAGLPRRQALPSQSSISIISSGSMTPMATRAAMMRSCSSPNGRPGCCRQTPSWAVSGARSSVSACPARTTPLPGARSMPFAWRSQPWT